MEELANAFVNMAKGLDPYGFADNGTEEEAYEETRRLLSSDDGMCVLASWMNEVMDLINELMEE